MNPPEPRPSVWQRRVVQPIVAQLTQGVTPDRIALTLAVGVTCGLFPFLGLTTALCFVAAVAAVVWAGAALATFASGGGSLDAGLADGWPRRGL